MNYVGKFIPNLSEMVAPLRELLMKNVSWTWGNGQDVALKKIKELLVSKRRCKQASGMQVNASRSGIGAVLIQDGKPVVYASKSLTPTQWRYAIIEQEMLKGFCSKGNIIAQNLDDFFNCLIQTKNTKY